MQFIESILKNRKLIWELTKKDFRQRYLGSYLGILWAFIQPMVTVMIFWFVFQVGFKARPVENFPFILWLICGIFPWNFFNDALNGGTNSIIGNSYLVKKIFFNISLLPIVQIMSALLIHVFFICVTFLMFMFYGYMPSVYNFQIIYYLFAIICLTFGISLITASLIIFLRDIGQIVMMILQFGFWITPVFWSYAIIPRQYIWFLKLNPLFYIVEGYRDSFINHQWFWHKMHITIFFWVFTSIIIIIGGFLFKKLKPHFADVL